MSGLPLRILRIVEQVALAHDVTVADLMESRRRLPSRARFSVWAILKAEGKSTTQIGNYFRRDHTSVMSGLRRLAQAQQVAA